MIKIELISLWNYPPHCYNTLKIFNLKVILSALGSTFQVVSQVRPVNWFIFHSQLLPLSCLPSFYPCQLLGIWYLAARWMKANGLAVRRNLVGQKKRESALSLQPVIFLFGSHTIFFLIIKVIRGRSVAVQLIVEMLNIETWIVREPK